jgi:hypothetical protein
MQELHQLLIKVLQDVNYGSTMLKTAKIKLLVTLLLDMDFKSYSMLMEKPGSFFKLV